MTSPQLRFDDGAGYEVFMGRWSQLVADQFLAWLAPSQGLRWLDVGCGNGAFTELLAERLSPASLQGIDPSPAQLVFARERPALRDAHLLEGDAMALPCADASVDAAVMPLVIVFVPEPARGVAEMMRVVAPGGSVSAYMWDMAGGGFPYATLHELMREEGFPVPLPPRPEMSGEEALEQLWTATGLESVGTCSITVTRSFADFDTFWAAALKGPSVRRTMEGAPEGGVARLEARLRERLAPDARGLVTVSARANAVKGVVPRV